MLPIEQPFKVYTGLDGKPLDNGCVYFGLPNQEPKANPVTVYWDAAGTQPAAQPLRTMNGYIVRAGTPANVFYSTDYSQLVLDKRGAQVFYARTSTDYSIANVVLSFISSLASSVGSALVGFIQDGTGAILRTVQEKLRDQVNAKDYGLVGDGVTDDTTALRNAIARVMTAGAPKRLVIPYGASGQIKVTSQIEITTGGITIEFENNNITIQKNFNGEVFYIKASLVHFKNPGGQGNGASFTGGFFRFSSPSTFATFDCAIDNPRIQGTRDSCIILEGPRGGAGIEVSGGTLLTYNASGASSGGYPSIRLVGPQDGDTSDRIFTGITSSAQPLIDFTGMWVTKVSDCFCGTMHFKGNPDVTGVGAAFSSCNEVFITNTYTRDGMTISGSEVMVDNTLTHGKAPIYTVYGGDPTSFDTNSYIMTSDSIGCHLGDTIVASNGIRDDSPNGHAIGNQCSSFSYGTPMTTVWEGAVSNPVVGNGSVLSIYDEDYKTINFRFTLTSGSTTTYGSGQWYISLPKWASLFANPVGNWAMFRPAIGWTYGVAILTSTGATHKISLLEPSGTFLSAAFAGGFPTGTQIYVDFSYSKG